MKHIRSLKIVGGGTLEVKEPISHAGDEYVIVARGGELIIQKRFVPSGATVPPKRGEIHDFSVSSRAAMRRYLAGATADYRIMGTLTYPQGYPCDGPTIKEHLKRFGEELRRECGRLYPGSSEKWSFFWFLEFQSRGAPHFHYFTTHYVSKEWVAKTWYRIVGSDDARHLAAGTRVEWVNGGRRALRSYAGKYAAKSEQKVVPVEFARVGRWWGVHGLREVAEAICSFSVEGLSAPQRNGLRKAWKGLLEYVEEALSSGDAKVVVRKPGFRVIRFSDRMFKRLMFLVAKLSLVADDAIRAGWDHDLFATAELVE